MPTYDELTPEDVVPAQRAGKFTWQDGDVEIDADAAERTAFERDLVDDADRNVVPSDSG